MSRHHVVRRESHRQTVLVLGRTGLLAWAVASSAVGCSETESPPADANCASAATCSSGINPNAGPSTSPTTGTPTGSTNNLPGNPHGGNAGQVGGGGVGPLGNSGSANDTGGSSGMSPTPTGAGGNTPSNQGGEAGNAGPIPTGSDGSDAGSGGTNPSGNGGMGGAGGSGNGTAGTAAGGNGGSAGSVSRVLGEPNATATNPIITHVFTADPSADNFNGRIYVYTSHDLDDQTSYDMYDYHAFSSDDLVNWQDHGIILDARTIDWATSLYAPDCIYSERNNKYYLYFPDGGSSIGVAVSDTPEGPFEDALGGPLIERGTTPGVADVDWVFDPTAFIDDDGQAYLYFGGGPSGDEDGDNARVIRLNEDMISTNGEAVTIPAPEFFEASFLHKRDGKYYFSYSGDFRSHAAWIEYMVSDDPMTGFEYAGTVLKEPQGNNGDNNHHSIVEYQGQWYLFYHNRVLGNRLGGYTNYQRSITLDLLNHDAQGNIIEVPTVMGEVRQLKSVDGLARIEAEMMAAESGVETTDATEEGVRVGVAVTDLQNDDWIGYSQVDFADGVTRMHARVASNNGGTIEVMQDGCAGFRENTGTLAGSCEVSSTDAWQTWTDIECSVSISGGVHDLCLRFVGTGEQLLNLNYFRFE